MKLAAGLFLALCSAFTLNWSFFVQHAEANLIEPLRLAHPLRALRMLFSNRRWLAGYLVGYAGWGLYIGALALAPLSIVQSCTGAGVGLLALLVHRFSATPLRRSEALFVLLAIAGLGLLGVSLVFGVPNGTPANPAGIGAAIGVCVALAVVCASFARHARGGAALGAAAGLTYAAGDIATKGAVSGRGALFVIAILVCHVLGFVLLQLGFQRAGALATAGVSTLLINAIPVLAGVVVFGESVPPGGAGALRVLAFLAVLAGATGLARPATPVAPGSAP